MAAGAQPPVPPSLLPVLLPPVPEVDVVVKAIP
jgi:hypothetical protein